MIHLVHYHIWTKTSANSKTRIQFENHPKVCVSVLYPLVFMCTWFVCAQLPQFSFHICATEGSSLMNDFKVQIRKVQFKNRRLSGWTCTERLLRNSLLDYQSKYWLNSFLRIPKVTFCLCLIKLNENGNPFGERRRNMISANHLHYDCQGNGGVPKSSTVNRKQNLALVTLLSEREVSSKFLIARVLFSAFGLGLCLGVFGYLRIPWNLRCDQEWPSDLSTSTCRSPLPGNLNLRPALSMYEPLEFCFQETYRDLMAGFPLVLPSSHF